MHTPATPKHRFVNIIPRWLFDTQDPTPQPESMASNIKAEDNSASNYNTFHRSTSDEAIRVPVDSLPKVECKNEHAILRPVSRPVTVEPALVLYYVAFMISTPLQIQYINYAVRKNLHINSSNINTTNGTDACGNVGESDSTQTLVQSESAMYMTAMTLSALLPSLFTTILLGAYSDQAGRKFALIPTLCGEIIRVFVCIIVTGANLPLWLICIGLFAQGMTGGAPAFMMSCFSYIADVTSPEKRSVRIFIVELAMGLGQVIAQVAIGQAIDKLGYFYTFLIVMAIHIINLIYIIFILPETLIKAPNCRLLSIDHYRRTLGLYFKSSMKGKRVDLGLGLAIIALCGIIGTANNETITLFLVNPPLCWQSIMIGYYTAAVYAIRIVGSVILLKIFAGKISGLVLAMGSFISAAAYDLVIGVTSETWTMFLAAALGFAVVIAEPMIRSHTSKEVNGDLQGALFASQAWISMLCALLGTVMFNGIYSASTTYPGLVFICAAALYSLPFTFTIILYIRFRKTSKQPYESFDNDLSKMDQN